MSTISDAFKKKDDDKKRRNNALASEYPQLLEQNNDRRKLWAVLLLTVALIAGIGAGFLLMSLIGQDRTDLNAKSAEKQVSTPDQSPDTVEQFPDIKLEAIVSDPSNPQAIVNGQIIGVGSEIEGVYIKGIYNWGIVVEYQGTRKEIRKP